MSFLSKFMFASGLALVSHVSAMAQFGPTVLGAKQVMIEVTSEVGRSIVFKLWVNGTKENFPMPNTLPNDQRLTITDVEAVVEPGNYSAGTYSYSLQYLAPGAQDGFTNAFEQEMKFFDTLSTQRYALTTGLCIPPGSFLAFGGGGDLCKRATLRLHGYFNQVSVFAVKSSLETR